MSAADQRKRLKAHYTNFNAIYAGWLAQGDFHQRPKIEPLPLDLKACGAAQKPDPGHLANKRRFISMADASGMAGLVPALRLR